MQESGTQSATAPAAPDSREAWHALPVNGVVSRLETEIERGLPLDEARRRLDQHGYNELREQPRPSFWRMLLDQFDNFVVIILIAASIVSAFLGDWVEAAAILAIVVLNAVLGVVQERRAEAALAALRKLAAPDGHVVRDGHRQVIPARELVPGDIVLLEAGNYVPADLRLVEGVNLRIEEAALTGESAPVEKRAGAVLDRELPLGDRHNTAYMGTLVTYGRGRGVVTATGMNTEIGLIAQMLQTLEAEPTPLQRRLDQLGKSLGIGTLIVCAVVLASALVRITDIGELARLGPLAYFADFKKQIVDMFLVAVSLAIAAVPEGLPAVVTVTLALGMSEMIKRHALIRRLPAVETLGSATAICSDKTGTLTQNEMTVVRLWSEGERLTVTGNGYRPEGEFTQDGRPVNLARYSDTTTLLWAALLCNDADLEVSGAEDGRATYRVVGDPTEGALVVAAAKAGLWKRDLNRAYPRAVEVPFDAERKRMTTIHELA
ncbi:MAG: HAD-IC family P-type ATPase, partial [Chloroflexi bacterium]|nr:HAD-IC family P-type ATPase [Chloroflexota bacterium]